MTDSTDTQEIDPIDALVRGLEGSDRDLDACDACGEGDVTSWSYSPRPGVALCRHCAPSRCPYCRRDLDALASMAPDERAALCGCGGAS